MDTEKIPFNYLCLLGCIRNPEKCPEYFFEICGLLQGLKVDLLQSEWEQYIIEKQRHTPIWYNGNKER
jgi:hypothetical protein